MSDLKQGYFYTLTINGVVGNKAVYVEKVKPDNKEYELVVLSNSPGQNCKIITCSSQVTKVHGEEEAPLDFRNWPTKYLAAYLNYKHGQIIADFNEVYNRIVVKKKFDSLVYEQVKATTKTLVNVAKGKEYAQNDPYPKQARQETVAALRTLEQRRVFPHEKVESKEARKRRINKEQIVSRKRRKKNPYAYRDSVAASKNLNVVIAKPKKKKKKASFPETANLSNFGSFVKEILEAAKTGVPSPLNGSTYTHWYKHWNNKVVKSPGCDNQHTICMCEYCAETRLLTWFGQ